MSYAASILSTTGTFAAYGRRLSQHGRPDIEILVDNHEEAKTYTTFDALSGTVNITAPFDSPFDAIRITLEGTVKTVLDNLAPTSSRTKVTATHNFLRLTMPLRESHYPQPRVAEAGKTYSFPFHFVIPDQLLPRSCSHEYSTGHVHEAHLQLPPSMGNLLTTLRDDMAPEMSRVQYAVKAKVVRYRGRDDRDIVLVEDSKNLRVVPAVAEAPPMSLGDGYNHHYVLSKTKSLKKGVFSGKLGRITVSASQTGAIILPAPSSASTVPATTMATVRLRFDPRDESSEPPRLGGLTTKIRSSTFFASKPESEIPNRINSMYDPVRGTYTTSIPLSSRCVESVTWERQQACQRRNSEFSTSSSDNSDSERKQENNAHYTATIVVPISLPKTKAWLPTFHSCIVSRIYTLDLSLTIHTPGTAIPATTVVLHLPVQIAAAGNERPRAQLTPAEAAAELAEVDEFFRPRVIEVPRTEFAESSVSASELPPSYEDFFSGSTVAIQRVR